MRIAKGTVGNNAIDLSFVSAGVVYFPWNAWIFNEKKTVVKFYNFCFSDLSEILTMFYLDPDWELFCAAAASSTWSNMAHS